MKRNLPAIQQNSLVRVKNNLDILNKLINIDNDLQIYELNKRIIDFFLDNSETFILAISKYYPLTYSLIEKYQDIWDWFEIEYNENIKWSLNFLEKYSRSNLHFKSSEYLKTLNLSKLLKYNKNLIWSDELINLGIKKLGHDGFTWSVANDTDFKWTVSLLKEYYIFFNPSTWLRLSKNPNLPWTEDLIALFEDNWYWEELSSNEGLPWTEELLERYANKWSWKFLSDNAALPWTEELVEKYVNKWDWRFISKNEVLPWTKEFIAKNQNYFEWGVFIRNHKTIKDFPGSQEVSNFDYGLSSNKALPWSEEFIQHYSHKICWEALSINEGVPWTLSFIKKNIRKLSNRLLQGNPSLPWVEILSDKTFSLLHYNWTCSYISWRTMEKYPDIYPNAKTWDSILIKENYGQCFPTCSDNESLPWSEDLIEEYVGVWDWQLLSANSAIPWTTELAEKYLDNLFWPTLLRNSNFPWTFDFLEKHWNSIEEYRIKYFSYSVIPKIAYNKIFKPLLNDTLIDEILKEIIVKNKMK